MPKQRPKSMSGQLADMIRTRITAGDWCNTMPPERSLADEFFVSRSTVRKALAMLQSEGCISSSQSTRKGRQIAITKHSTPHPEASGLVIVLTPNLSDSPLLFEHLAIIREKLSHTGVRVEVREAAHLAEMKDPQSTLDRMIAKRPGAIWILHKMPQSVQIAAQNIRLRCIIYGSSATGLKIPFVDVDFAAVARHATGRCIAKGMF